MTANHYDNHVEQTANPGLLRKIEMKSSHITHNPRLLEAARETATHSKVNSIFLNIKIDNIKQTKIKSENN